MNISVKDLREKDCACDALVLPVTEAGAKLGLSRQDAVELAVQTMLGTAKLLDTGMAPENLRTMVTSPGGTTAAGLKVFGERDLKGVVAEALKAAWTRAEELGRR